MFILCRFLMHFIYEKVTIILSMYIINCNSGFHCVVCLHKASETDSNYRTAN